MIKKHFSKKKRLGCLRFTMQERSFFHLEIQILGSLHVFCMSHRQTFLSILQGASLRCRWVASHSCKRFVGRFNSNSSYSENNSIARRSAFGSLSRRSLPRAQKKLEAVVTASRNSSCLTRTPPSRGREIRA